VALKVQIEALSEPFPPPQDRLVHADHFSPFLVHRGRVEVVLEDDGDGKQFSSTQREAINSRERESKQSTAAEKEMGEKI
jgi:hypothetical protein